MFEKIKSLLKITKFSGTITLLDGTQVIVDGSVEVGSKVYVSLPDAAEPVVLPDGEYPLEDGSIMVVTEGIISDIKPKEEPQPEIKKEEINMYLINTIDTNNWYVSDGVTCRWVRTERFLKNYKNEFGKLNLPVDKLYSSELYKEFSKDSIK